MYVSLKTELRTTWITITNYIQVEETRIVRVTKKKT